ncbi:MAG: aminomethyl-transferring glycine dehydrogenase subunit GcvPA [Deltaproteobacteria bacterium]
MRYHPHTEADVTRLLAAIGAPSLDALFAPIPEPLRLKRPLRLPPPLDERSLLDYFEGLAAKNRVSPAPFLGAGAYPHHVPAAVDQLLLRSEFYTAYTPYQPELAQGTLQAIFEFQTFVCLLTGLEVANASMYDGATASAEAALLALRLRRGRGQVVLSRALHPSYRDVVRTYLHAGGREVVEVPFDPKTGRTDAVAFEKALSEKTAFALVQSPNFLGAVEELRPLADATHRAGALFGAAVTEPLSLGLFEAPGALGADVCVGELQSFGNGLSFGGPGVGFFAAKAEFLRQLPGRLCGETVDNRGKRAFVLTLSTREQHIRRENATSNICTNHGLCALASTIHLALLGRRGVRELALLNWRRARHARQTIGQRRFSAPIFNEFVVSADERAVARAREAGFVPGLPLSRFLPELSDALLVCVTELHSPERIDSLAAVLRAKDGKGAR